MICALSMARCRLVPCTSHGHAKIFLAKVHRMQPTWVVYWRCPASKWRGRMGFPTTIGDGEARMMNSGGALRKRDWNYCDRASVP